MPRAADRRLHAGASGEKRARRHRKLAGDGSVNGGSSFPATETTKIGEGERDVGAAVRRGRK